MKRDPRLQGLSSDHHHALVLARRMRQALAADSADAAFARSVHDAYRDELAPHFAIEEDVLLGALETAGHGELAARTRADHDRLRALFAALGQGTVDPVEPAATLLEQHVRFEERELFPACERSLDDAVLDRVAARARKHSPA